MSIRWKIAVAAVLVFFLPSATFAADIHKAARKGDLEEVQALIAAGADLSELDKAVGAPLHWAAARGHADVARELIAHEADPSQEARAPDRLTPLHMAAASGHVELAALLVEAGADLSAGVGTTGTPLHFAARENKAEVAEYLLNAGADPASRATDGAYGIYPLQFAAQAGASDAIRVLLKHGAPVNGANEANGVTALHLAVFNGQVDAARILLEAGADPNAESTNIETPLRLAQYTPELKELFTALGIE